MSSPISGFQKFASWLQRQPSAPTTAIEPRSAQRGPDDAKRPLPRPCSEPSPTASPAAACVGKPVLQREWPGAAITSRQTIEARHGKQLGPRAPELLGNLYHATLEALGLYEAAPHAVNLSAMAGILEACREEATTAAPDLHQALSTLLEAVRKEEALVSLAATLATAMEGGCLKATEIMGLLRQGVPPQALLEARTSGLDPSTIQALYLARLRIPPSKDPSAPVPTVECHTVDAKAMQVLGTGYVASAIRFEQVRDGQRKAMVFKAENPEADPGHPARCSGIPEGAANLSNRAACSWEVSRLLGLDLVTPTRVAVVNGRAGAVMDLAPGAAPMCKGRIRVPLAPAQAQRLAASPAKLATYQAQQGFSGATLEGHTLVLEHRVERAKKGPQGQPVWERDGKTQQMASIDWNCMEPMPVDDPVLRKQLTQLQWLDHLTNEQDRGPENFFVLRDGQGHVERVTAIDCDASFGARSTPSRSSRLPPTYPKLIDPELLKALQTLTPQALGRSLEGRLSRDEVNAALRRLEAMQAHLSNPETCPWVVKSDEEWADKPVAQALGLETAMTGFRDATRVASAPPMASQENSQDDPSFEVATRLNALQKRPEHQHYVARLALEQERQRWELGLRPPEDPRPWEGVAIHDPKALQAVLDAPEADAPLTMLS